MPHTGLPAFFELRPQLNGVIRSFCCRHQLWPARVEPVIGVAWKHMQMIMPDILASGWLIVLAS